MTEPTVGVNECMSARLNNPSLVDERSLAHLRATTEERARILGAGCPFDATAWLRDTVPATPEEAADLNEFLRELEAMRQYNLERQEELFAELGE